MEALEWLSVLLHRTPGHPLSWWQTSIWTSAGPPVGPKQRAKAKGGALVLAKGPPFVVAKGPPFAGARGRPLGDAPKIRLLGGRKQWKRLVLIVFGPERPPGIQKTIRFKQNGREY